MNDYSELDEMFKKNPDIIWPEYQEKSKIKLSQWSFYNRKRKLKELTSSNQKVPHRLSQLLDEIKKHPEGLSVSQIQKKFNWSSNTVYAAIHELRKEFNIPQENGMYILKESSVPSTSLTVPVINDDQIRKYVSPQTMRLLQKLPPSDKEDYLAALKKSIFYHMSAEAILIANQMVDEIKHHL